MLRGALVRLFRQLISLYFQSIEEVGERPSESTRSRIFVSNHVNALIDPILVITRAPCEVSPIAKSTLWKIPGLRWLLDTAKAVPVVRKRDDPNKSAAANDAVFEKVAGFLASGGNILIFPEGTSHNEPQLLKLKTGAARMLLRAEAEGARDATFQAVGLEFEARDIFRSRALILYGPVRDVRDVEPEASLDRRVDAITEAMQADLSELLVEGPTWSERLLVARVAELLRNESGDSSLAGWSSIGRQVEAAQKTLSATDPERIAPVARSVTEYFDLLEATGLTDDLFAANGEVDPGVSLASSLTRWALRPLALLGVALYWVPYQAPRQVARRAHDVDMHSTLKLGTGLVVYPVWLALLVGVVAVALPRLGLGVGAIVAIVAAIVASPFAALDWLEHRGKLSRSVLLATRARRLTELARARARALEHIREVHESLAG